MKIYLRDNKQSLADAWKEVFQGYPDVHVSCGDIFAAGDHMNCEAIISPANSFGFMDGGIDFIYSSYFGWGIGDALREELWQNYGGELLVGQAVVTDMQAARQVNLERVQTMRYLIAAPTMRVPMDVSTTVNAYLAFSAALKVAKAASIDSILCPGLATAIGKMPPRVCAVQMLEAYERYNKPRFFDVLGNAHRLHHSMLNADTYLGSNICGLN